MLRGMPHACATSWVLAVWPGHPPRSRPPAGVVTSLAAAPWPDLPACRQPAGLVPCWCRFVDVGLWAGLVPANARDPAALRAMVKAGALGFKAFMSPSGIDDFPHVSPEDVVAALPTIRALGVPLLVHAELVDGNVPRGVSSWWRPATRLSGEGDGEMPCSPAAQLAGSAVLRHLGEEPGGHCGGGSCPALGPTAVLALACWQGNSRKHATWLASRPRRFEQNAVRALLDALRATAGNATLPGFKLHIVHLSGELARAGEGRDFFLPCHATWPSASLGPAWLLSCMQWSMQHPSLLCLPHIPGAATATSEAA